MLLNNDIKSKKKLLDELNKKYEKKKPKEDGAGFDKGAAEEFQQLQGSIIIKDKKIEELLNRVKVLEHEYEKVKGYREAGKKMHEMEAKLKEKERLLEVQEKKMKEQEEAMKAL